MRVTISYIPGVKTSYTLRSLVSCSNSLMYKCTSNKIVDKLTTYFTVLNLLVCFLKNLHQNSDLVLDTACTKGSFSSLLIIADELQIFEISRQKMSFFTFTGIPISINVTWKKKTDSHDGWVNSKHTLALTFQSI